MEDKQPAAGDLTAEAEVGTDKVRDESGDATTQVAPIVADPAPETPEETDADGGAEEGDGEDADQEADEETAEGAEPEVISFRARRPGGKGILVAFIAAAVLFVAGTGYAGAAMQPYLADRALAATKLTIARTAAQAITTLWTYTPENMDGLADRAQQYLSGDFEAQYRRFMDSIVAPNKQAKITNTTEVSGVGVESLDEGESRSADPQREPTAIAIVYTNTTSTSPLTKNVPSLRYLAYRVFMKRTNGRWLVNRMATITSLDLTPHL